MTKSEKIRIELNQLEMLQ